MLQEHACVLSLLCERIVTLQKSGARHGNFISMQILIWRIQI
jgi:hypothetical protein